MIRTQGTMPGVERRGTGPRSVEGQGIGLYALDRKIPGFTDHSLYYRAACVSDAIRASHRRTIRYLIKDSHVDERDKACHSRRRRPIDRQCFAVSSLAV